MSSVAESSTKETPEEHKSEEQSKDTNTVSHSNDFSEAKKRLLVLKTEADKIYVQCINKRFEDIRCDIRNWNSVYTTKWYEIRKDRNLNPWYCFFSVYPTDYFCKEVIENELSKFVKSLNEEGFKAYYEEGLFHYNIKITIET